MTTNKNNLTDNNILQYLPEIRGRYSVNAKLAPITWFNVGGCADVMFKPKDMADLQYFLKNKPIDIPLTTLGVGSNLLIRDGGISGIVIRLGREFATIEKTDRNEITVGAAALDINLAKFAAKSNIAGFEFYSGIPGTIGGALRMNAGAYDACTNDILKVAYAVSPDGKLHKLSIKDMGFDYRYCAIANDWIFIKAVFQGHDGDFDKINQRMGQIKSSRMDSQPIKGRTGGSTFKNPVGYKAWKLIDDAGCRGMQIGKAQISNQHCNFIINNGDATAADIEALGLEVQRMVKAKSGINLNWEIKRIGRLNHVNGKANGGQND